MELRTYLSRINFTGGTEPTLSTLTALQHAHICTVPFENLDVQLGRPISTDVPAAFDKIVNHRRGGWCYEQNGLFGWALTELGFNVTRIAASVMRQAGNKQPPANHLCLLVRCEDQTNQEYLVDVGFGGSMLKPLPLASADHALPPFQVGIRRLTNDYWQFWEDTGDGEFCFDFQSTAGDETALDEQCHFLQHAPSSSFVLNLVAQRRAKDSHKVLRGRVLTTRNSNGKQQETIESAQRLVQTLDSDFGLDLPEAAELWPKVVARHQALFEGSD